MKPNELLQDLDSYKDKYNRKFYLIKFDKERQALQSWGVKYLDFGTYELHQYDVDAGIVCENELQRMNLWQKCDEDTQIRSNKPIILAIEPNVGKNDTKSSKTKKPTTTRKKEEFAKYHTITCKNCKKTSKVNPYQVKLKAVRENKPIEVYVKEFVCRTCTSEKDNKDIPTELKCIACNAVTKYHPSMIKNIAKRKGITIAQLLKEYKCKKCFTRKKKGKG
jgi:hypothetical protein